MKFETWSKKAKVKEAIHFGYLRRHERDIYDMLGMTIFVETIFNSNFLKSNTERVLIPDFNLTPDSPIMQLAEEYGAKWEEGYYADEGYGWPVWIGSWDKKDTYDPAKQCFLFIQAYKKAKREGKFTPSFN